MVSSPPPDNDNSSNQQTDKLPDEAITPQAEATTPGNHSESGANTDTMPWARHLALLRGLAEIVEAEDISELEVEDEGVRITLKGPSAAIFAVNVQSALQLTNPLATQALPPVGVSGAALAGGLTQPDAPGSASKTAKPDENLVPIVSPMIGVFYRASSPDNPPLVEVGDYVEIGQEVGLVEAMKVFNEITSEVEGTVVEIRAQNAQLVETGSVLILIRKP